MKFVAVSCYLGAFVGLQEDMEVWMMPEVEQWMEGVQSLSKVST